MQLTTILLIATSILAFLSGLSVMIGAPKKSRANGVWFFVATLFVVAWSVSIAGFLTLRPEQADLAPLAVFAIYAGAILTDVALLGYICWHFKLGKWLMAFFAVFGAAILAIAWKNPSALYSAIEITNAGNRIVLVYDWCFGLLLAFFSLITFAFSGFLLYRIRAARNKNMRFGYMIFLIGLSVSGVLSLLFDLIQINPEFVWIGPLGTSIVVLAFYYAVLHYRMLKMSSFAMKMLSYVVIMAAAAIVYVLLFFVVFSALFRGTPSTSVFLLNFIMVLIMLLLMPAISEVSAVAKSLSSTQKVDIAYVVKKLNNLTAKKINLRQLAEFLAEHMHFSFVGFLIDGRLYSSEDITLSANEILQVSGLKVAKDGIWQDFNEPMSRVAAEHNITAVAELRDAKNEVFGQIIVGKPQGKLRFERNDLVQLEMIINLVAAIVESEKHALKG